MNNYPDSLLRIDDEMLALGRPVAPIQRWRAAGFRGLPPKEAHGIWRAQVDSWEVEFPQKAIRYAELDAQYVAEEERLEQLKYDKAQGEWSYALLARLGCPRDAIDTIRSDFRDTASMKAANEWTRQGTEWSLVLIGGNGCGKSCAAAWAAHQLLGRNFRPVWVDCASLSQSNLYNIEAEHYRWKCRTSPSLVLDDLGTKRQVERDTGPWLGWVDEVVGFRANERKKTIITTNRTPDELGAWLGERLTDRLRNGVVHSSEEKSMRGDK